MKSEITIPTSLLERFIAEEEKDMADYKARGNSEMEHFAIGRLSVYRNLLEVWGS